MKQNQLNAIAKQHLGFASLETKNDELCDFREIAVWNAKAALEAAFACGVAYAELAVRNDLNNQGGE